MTITRRTTNFMFSNISGFRQFCKNVKGYINMYLFHKIEIECLFWQPSISGPLISMVLKYLNNFKFSSTHSDVTLDNGRWQSKELRQFTIQQMHSNSRLSFWLIQTIFQNFSNISNILKNDLNSDFFSRGERATLSHHFEPSQVILRLKLIEN